MKKHKKSLILVATLLLALMITGGVFAYGFLSDSITLTLDDEPDFAKVEASSYAPSWQVFGSYTGNVPEGSIFVITPHPDWPGDLLCQVTLANPGELLTAYRGLTFGIQILDTYSDQLGTTEYLTLRNSTVEIEFSQTAGPYRVRIVNGYYISNRAGWNSGNEDPTFLCNIAQR